MGRTLRQVRHYQRYVTSAIAVVLVEDVVVISRNPKVIWKEAALLECCTEIVPVPHCPYALQCTAQFPLIPKKLPWGIQTTSNTRFRGLIQPTTPNGIAVKSAVFPQCTFVTSGQTNRHIDQPTEHTRNWTCKNRPLTLVQRDVV